MQRPRSTLLLILASALMLSGPVSPLLAAGQEASNQGSLEPTSEPRQTATPTAVPPTELPPPDLAGRLMAPRIVQGGSMVSITGIISNRGGPAEGFAATVTADSGAHEVVVWSENISGLGYGEEYSIAFDWAPGLGLSRLGLTVDPASEIAESDEENNRASSWIQRSTDQAVDVAQPIRFEHAADRSQARPESEAKWEGKRLQMSVRPTGPQAVTVLVHKEWLDSRIENPALEGATFSFIEREGVGFYAFEVSTREWKHATWKPFDAGIGEQNFGWGAARHLVLGNRPMHVSVLDLPRAVHGTKIVQTPNGSMEVDAPEYNWRLSIDFDGQSHDGQDLWVSAGWLDELGISNPVFRHEDGEQVPSRRVGDYFYLRPSHFSVIHSFASSSDIWQVVNGQPSSSVSFDSANQRMHIESQRADTSEESAIRTFVPHRQYTLTGRFGVTRQGNWQGANALAVGNEADRLSPTEDFGARKAFGFFYYSRDDYSNLPIIEAYTRSATGTVDQVWSWTAPSYEGWSVTLGIRVTGTTTFLELGDAFGVPLMSGSRANSALPTSHSDVIFFGSEDLDTDSYEVSTLAWVDQIVVTPQEGNFINEDFGSTSQWTLAGSAACCSGGYLQLTDNVANQVGRAIFNTGLVASRFSAEFRFSVGPNSGSSGADGLAFMFYKETAYTPAGGGRLGFQDSNDGSLAGHIGYGITFDEWINTEYNDVNGDDMAFVENHVGGQRWYATNMGLSGGTWHTVNVEVTEGRIVVWYDDVGPTPYVFDHTFSRTYSGVGFSAGTGGLSNYHRLDYVRISIPPTAAANQPPTACFVGPAQATLNQAIVVNASCSTDDTTATGNLQVRWDWEYPSGWDTGYTTNKEAFLPNGYSTAGTKTIGVQVLDTDGATDTTTRTVVVNSPPSACINTPSVNQLLVSVSSCSTDPEGHALTHTWNWGDGSPTSSGSTASHTYACPGGTYAIGLSVSDSLGASSSTSRDATTSAPDSDGDGLKNCQETVYGTNPNDADSDDDGANDGAELALWNAIGATAWQTNYNRDMAGSANNLIRRDADGDGLADGIEFSPPTSVFAYCANVGGRNECPSAQTRDVYLQLNWMEEPASGCLPFVCSNLGHTDRPPDADLATMRNNFANWNSGRPNNDRVLIHIYAGHFGDGTGAQDLNGDFFPHANEITFDPRPGQWNDFYDYKGVAFHPSRAGVFLFAFFGHTLVGSGSPGLAELFGNDHLLLKAQLPTSSLLVGVWMQELGHNLIGQRHSLCSHNHGYLHNPEAITIDLVEHSPSTVPPSPAGPDIDEGNNAAGTCGTLDQIQDVFAHSSRSDDAMGRTYVVGNSATTFSSGTWLALKPWKAIERAGAGTDDATDPHLYQGPAVPPLPELPLEERWGPRVVVQAQGWPKV